MDSLKERVVTRLLADIDKSGLSQRRYCQLRSFPHSTLRKILSSGENSLKSATITDIARAIGVDVGELARPLV